MFCYCANFYGAVNCQNKVTRFGDRCHLCMAMNEGSSAADELHFDSPPKYRMSSTHQRHSNNHDHNNYNSNNYNCYNNSSSNNSRKIIIGSDEKRPCGLFQLSSDECESCDCAVESGSDDSRVFSRRGCDYGGQ
ncbi:hypothetical protein F5Y07DRAFT_406073 [Xylaria sp. FL0933]|nr:hypothetical protein F5Y07DRAFT_406073 [Xylaria sp. FL0933]